MLIFSALAGSPSESNIRPPAVAGQFYPADPARLRLAIQEFLKDAVTLKIEKPAGLVVPHAGYIFSGQICADAYRQVAAQTYDLVVILGTNHTEGSFRKISIWANGGYRTPLGVAAVDADVATALIAQDSDCTKNQTPQIREHSVEVQVPFVQTMFPAAKILPVVIGEAEPAMCARFGKALARVLKERRALIVASSDLSHYPKYADAANADRQTLETIASLNSKAFAERMRSLASGNIPNLGTGACGEAPITVLLEAAKSMGATRGVTVSYANSGDTSVGDEGRVVGYGAVVLAGGALPAEVQSRRRPAPAVFSALQADQKKLLLKIARNTIQRYLATETTPLVRGVPPRLEYPQGAFVTLRKRGELRGCIGHMAADFPLGRAVGAMAMEAAFNDRRFQPLQAAELPDIVIEISALTPMKPAAGAEEIVLGRDGVLLVKGGRSAVFLPQVATENHWGRNEMLENLCRKAGLEPGAWKSGAKFYVFQAEVFDESLYR